MYYFRLSTLDFWPSAFDPRPRLLTLDLGFRPSTYDPRPSTYDPRPSTYDPRPSTYDPRHSTITQTQLGINSTRDVWKVAKLDSPRRLVQFWENFQTSLVLLRGSPCKNRPLEFRKITELLHTFCVEEVIHKINKKRWLWNCGQF
jgi:hypothetical protein